jgi:hypothetical protein
VINNESGWYEGWMIHDLRVPRWSPRDGPQAQFGTMLQADADALAAMGAGHRQNDSSPPTAMRCASRARTITSPSAINHSVN